MISPNVTKFEKSHNTRNDENNKRTNLHFESCSAYSYGRLTLSEETSGKSNFAINWPKMNGRYRYKMGFYGLVELLNFFREKSEQTLDDQTPVPLEDILAATRSSQNTEKRF